MGKSVSCLHGINKQWNHRLHEGFNAKWYARLDTYGLEICPKQYVRIEYESILKGKLNIKIHFFSSPHIHSTHISVKPFLCPYPNTIIHVYFWYSFTFRMEKMKSWLKSLELEFEYWNLKSEKGNARNHNLNTHTDTVMASVHKIQFDLTKWTTFSVDFFALFPVSQVNKIRKKGNLDSLFFFAHACASVLSYF